MSSVAVRFEMNDDGRCVQTALRRIRDGLEKALLSDDPGLDQEATAAMLELVTDFLTSTDFTVLRAKRPDLAGTARGVFILRRGGGGALEVVETEGASQTSP